MSTSVERDVGNYCFRDMES